MSIYIIIKSKIKGECNWSGIEFSEKPAKIYTSCSDALDALGTYWLNDHNVGNGFVDSRKIKIIQLTTKEKDKKIADGSARF